MQTITGYHLTKNVINLSLRKNRSFLFSSTVISTKGTDFITNCLMNLRTSGFVCPC